MQSAQTETVDRRVTEMEPNIPVQEPQQRTSTIVVIGVANSTLKVNNYQELIEHT